MGNRIFNKTLAAGPSRKDALFLDGPSGVRKLAPPVLFPADLLTPMLLWFRADSAAVFGNGAEVTKWADGSGNGYHATPPGTGPSFIAAGINGLPSLRFTGSQGLFTTSDAQVTANNHSGFMVMKCTGYAQASQQNVFSWASASNFMLQHKSGGAPNIGLYDADGFGGYMWFPLNVPVIFSWISSPSGLIFRINGQSLYDNLPTKLVAGQGPASSLADLTITTANIFNNGFSQGEVGDLSEVLVFGSALSLAEVAGIEAYLAGRYNIPVVGNFATLKRCVLLGDSRSVPANANQGPAESTMSSLRNALGLDWLVIASGISGNTAAQMAARVPTDVLPYFDVSLDKNVVVVWGGVNSITTGSNAATIYASLLSCCSQVKAAGFKVVLCTEIENTDYSGPQEAVRVALNILINATSVPGTVDAIADIATAIGSGQPTHPTPAAGVTIANAIGAAVSAL
jgi:hypothetical protein